MSSQDNKDAPVPKQQGSAASHGEEKKGAKALKQKAEKAADEQGPTRPRDDDEPKKKKQQERQAKTTKKRDSPVASDDDDDEDVQPEPEQADTGSGEKERRAPKKEAENMANVLKEMMVRRTRNRSGVGQNALAGDAPSAAVVRAALGEAGKVQFSRIAKTKMNESKDLRNAVAMMLTHLVGEKVLDAQDFEMTKECQVAFEAAMDAPGPMNHCMVLAFEVAFCAGSGSVANEQIRRPIADVLTKASVSLPPRDFIGVWAAAMPALGEVALQGIRDMPQADPILSDRLTAPPAALKRLNTAAQVLSSLRSKGATLETTQLEKWLEQRGRGMTFSAWKEWVPLLSKKKLPEVPAKVSAEAVTAFMAGAAMGIKEVPAYGLKLGGTPDHALATEIVAAVQVRTALGAQKAVTKAVAAMGIQRDEMDNEMRKRIVAAVADAVSRSTPGQAHQPGPMRIMQ